MSTTKRSALLFDIDGTLADTDRLHLGAFNEIFAPHGHSFDAVSFKAELQGLLNEAISGKFLAHETAQRRQAIMDEKEAAFRRRARRGLEPLPGLVALLDRADKAGIPYAAVTNAPPANAELILDAIGIRHRFPAIVFGGELPHGKPHPMPYLEGLRRLDADASLSVAFEDSPSGIRSASGAGIATAGLMTTQDEATLKASGATLAAPDYEDSALLALIARIIPALA